ncbi:hypothetical protein FKP32DRAFT_1595085 [Trametes sanguinea]|nr:hypothetical protein FKP32DRAFT_1595085 [Trametes sanguinea]
MELAQHASLPRRSAAVTTIGSWVDTVSILGSFKIAPEGISEMRDPSESQARVCLNPEDSRCLIEVWRNR